MRLLAPALTLVAAIGPALAQPSDAPKRPTSRPADRVNWWNDRVFYQVFIRSFADSTTGPLAGDGIGDIQGLIEHLDYLNDGNPETTTDLGVGAICLMPIHPSPSYHGYDVTDFLDVHPQYGTIKDFKQLIAECHRRGIKVIMDLVMNHVSSEHQWFKDAADPKSDKRDCFIWSDTDPGWKGPWNQNVWHRLAPVGPVAADRYYYGLFSSSMPDLNLRSPAVTEGFRTVTQIWLSTYGVDGFRLDAAAHLIEEGQAQANTAATHAWLHNWNLEFKGVNLDALSIAEVSAGSEQSSTYVGDQADMVFEFSLAEAMIASVKAGSKDALIAAQKKVLELYRPNQYGRFLSNHDQPRALTQLGGDIGTMRCAAALLLTGPGVPFIYYGEEIGMTGDKPDEKIRTPMQWSGKAGAGFTSGKPWEAVNTGFEVHNVEREAVDPDSLLSYYRKLIHLRNAHPALATGRTWLVKTERAEVAAFLRYRETRSRPGSSPDARGTNARPSIDVVLVVVNVSDKPIEACSLALDEAQPLQGRRSAQDLLGNLQCQPLEFDDKGGFSGYKLGPLPPRAAAVIELKPM